MDKERLNKAAALFTVAALITAVTVVLAVLMLSSISSRREQFFVPLIIFVALSAFAWGGFMESFLSAFPVNDGKEKVYKVEVVNKEKSEDKNGDEN